jgi:hypothetical protein
LECNHIKYIVSNADLSDHINNKATILLSVVVYKYAPVQIQLLLH